MSVFGPHVGVFDGYAEVESMESRLARQGLDPNDAHARALLEAVILRELLAARTAERNALDDQLSAKTRQYEIQQMLYIFRMFFDDNLRQYIERTSDVFTNFTSVPRIFANDAGVPEGNRLTLTLKLRPAEETFILNVQMNLEEKVDIDLLEEEDTEGYSALVSSFESMVEGRWKTSDRGETYFYFNSFFHESNLKRHLERMLDASSLKKQLEPVLAAWGRPA